VGEAGRDLDDVGDAGREAEDEGEAGREAEDVGDAGPDLLALLVGELLGLAFMDLLEDGVREVLELGVPDGETGPLLLELGERDGDAGMEREALRLLLGDAARVPDGDAEGKLQPGVGITVGVHRSS